MLYFHVSNHADKKYIHYTCRQLHQITDQQIITSGKNTTQLIYSKKHLFVHFLSLLWWEFSFHFYKTSILAKFITTNVYQSLPYYSFIQLSMDLFLRSCSNTLCARLKSNTNKAIIFLLMVTVNINPLSYRTENQN